MRQYFEMKSKYPDAILLYRVGDFYETFGDDAKLVSEILGIVLTKRNNGGSDIALAGFPHHAMDLYLPRLVKAGYRVAVCEQLEKPSKEKKIVKRGVTEVVTPGINTNDNLLNSKRPNYLCAVVNNLENGLSGTAFLDFSTGQFLTFQGRTSDTLNLIGNYRPAELLYAKGSPLPVQLVHPDTYAYGVEEWIFDEDFCREKIIRQLNVQSLKGFGIDQQALSIISCGVILHYLENTENKHLAHINQIRRIADTDFLWLDPFTIRNLELVQSIQPNGQSLFEVMDCTLCPMGSRLLHQWILFPLIHASDIEARHDQVSAMVELSQLRSDLREEIHKIGDLARLTAKLAAAKFIPRHVTQLAASLELIGKIKQLLQSSDNEKLQLITQNLNTCDELHQDILARFKEELPVQIGKSETIAQGFSEELDEWRTLMSGAKEILLDLQKRESERTGISKLKIGYNNVFGYYLEVTNKYKHLDLIPDDWIRKQTLTNSERYITEELKQLEDKILNAEGKILELEQQLFDEFLANAQQFISTLQVNANTLGHVDVIASLAELAVTHHYVRPMFNENGLIQIEKGRHPVIEAMMPPGEAYIPNDVTLNKEDQQIIVITGPNMSGKSAVLRQTALISLMAQIGSFVPAVSADLMVLDRIFTRVGASDNISSGESTFMVEMNETANILNNLSSKSLLLLDEIGRGTSTFDGISIAWSIVEYLHDQHQTKPFALFATHYHELNELANKYDRIKNFHVSTKKVGQKVLFLRKLLPGSVEHSFGIYVAQLAGMPNEVIERSETILELLESQRINSGLIDDENAASGLSSVPKLQPMQLSFFEVNDPKLAEIKSLLEQTDINSLTPMEAMMRLQQLLDLCK